MSRIKKIIFSLTLCFLLSLKIQLASIKTNQAAKISDISVHHFLQGPLWAPVHTARATEPWPKGKLSAPRYIGTVVMTEPGSTVHFPRCWSWWRGAVQQVFFLFASCQTQWKAQRWLNKSTALNGLLNWWLQQEQVPPSLKPRTCKTTYVFCIGGKKRILHTTYFFLYMTPFWLWLNHITVSDIL